MCGYPTHGPGHAVHEWSRHEECSNRLLIRTSSAFHNYFETYVIEKLVVVYYTE